MDLTQQLIEVANHYGGDEEYCRAGGGNASVKRDGVLHIKPSGVPLATLAADDLVPLRLDVLLDALASDEPVEGDPVRAAAARALVRDTGRRPSVEILFHALIPDALVLHLHPLIANALTCNAEAERLAAELLGDEAVLVPYIDPGVPLARGVALAREAYAARTGRPAPGITLLRNHGIIVSGDSAAELRERTDWLTDVIQTAIAAAPLPSAPEPDAALARVRNAIAPTLRGLLGGDALAVVASDAGDLVRSVTTTPAGEAILTGGPLIPDQIVYAGSLPAVVELGEGDPVTATTEAVEAFRTTHGKDPVIVVVPGVAAFGAGRDLAAARNALATFTDALRVARDAGRIGRVQVMDAAERGFIENWEAEAYRQSVAAQTSAGRLVGKVVMITGAAQGFGLGIAQELITQGTSLVLADLNVDGAAHHAAAMCEQYGPGRAVAVRIDVSDEQSCLDAVAETVGIFGGLDVFISNAGVLRAESVFTQPVADFDLVTNVNYRGYFLGVRPARGSSPGVVRHHRDQLQIGAGRLEGQLRLRRLEVRRHRPHPVVRAGAGELRGEGERDLPRQLPRRPAVVRPGARALRPVPAGRQGARRHNPRRSPRPLREAGPDGTRLLPRRPRQGDLLHRRPVLRNRPGRPRHRWSEHVELAAGDPRLRGDDGKGGCPTIDIPLPVSRHRPDPTTVGSHHRRIPLPTLRHPGLDPGSHRKTATEG